MYGLIGAKLGHSYSKGIHEQLADYTFDMIELSAEELDVFLKEKNFHAVNVTIPYKQTVIPYLDEISEHAQKIGAVNTIVNVDGCLKGYNTDYYGFKYMLEYNDIAIKDRKVIVLGVGGASKAVYAVLADLQAKEVVFVHPKGKNGITYEECYAKHKDAQVIVNATPVGMYPNGDCTPIDVKRFTHLESAVDVIYNPLKTKFLVEAERNGVKTAGGLMMLVAQAKEAVEIFTGKSLEDGCIANITQQLEKEKRNIVLIGMPSCGKSTIAKALANVVNKQVVDIDDVIVERYGSIPDIFKQYGEDYFRDCETQMTKEMSQQTGWILACGGGIIKREENMIALKQNGKIIYIQRDLDLLIADDTRPLSSSKEAILKLYEERKSLYEGYSDYIIENNGTIEEVVQKIVEIL
ncbi:MAG: shikimate dehydrogenase [Erysipelotrichaceae bacterium]|nr:shikimate dehydrogenase [Erysipelotrichaceae bacterium]